MTIERLWNDDFSSQLPELRSEDEIIAGWCEGIDKPVVSICCITFNHETYIENALKGFLGQETTFAFEILIHDDASTDDTAKIIRQYEKKYPNIIKPIYQVENQYCKGLKINPTFNFPRAQGKYIAVCEGDDLWICADKLQKQYDVAQETGATVVFHSAVEWDLKLRRKSIICKHRDKDEWIPLIESVKGRGGFMPTASLFFLASTINRRIDWFEESMPLGDFFIQMIVSFYGSIYYISEPMCLYRRNAKGSWTESQKHSVNSKRYARSMMMGILSLYSRMDHKDRHYLAHPFYFYSKMLNYDRKRIVNSLFRMVLSTPTELRSKRLTFLYLRLLISESFTLLKKFLILRPGNDKL